MKYFLILFLLTASLPSLAKIHIEPYAGYGYTIISDKLLPEKINAKETIGKIGSSLSYVIDGKKYSNIVGGIRLGYRSIGLAVGVDLSMGKWKSITGSETLTPMTAGVFASYNLPLLFRVYGVIIPKPFARVSATNKDNSKTPLSCNRSGGGKLGLSYLSIPFLSINFEYQSLFIDGDAKICGTWSHSGTVFLNFMF